jgi:hypothetical protein
LFSRQPSGRLFGAKSQILNRGNFVIRSENNGFSKGTRSVEISHSCTTETTTITKCSSTLLRLRFTILGVKFISYLIENKLFLYYKDKIINAVRGNNWCRQKTNTCTVWAIRRELKCYHWTLNG